MFYLIKNLVMRLLDKDNSFVRVDIETDKIKAQQ